MKILHVAMDVNPAHGGPARSITGLCRALGDTGNEVMLFVHDATGSDSHRMVNYKFVGGSGIGLGGCMGKDIANVLDGFRPEIVHVHGIWDLAIHADEVALRRRGIPYIIAPRGSLDPWGLAQKRLKKLAALWLYQLRDLNKAAAIHTTCEMEADYVRKAGCTCRTFISPNGVNFPEDLPPRRLGADGKRRFLFLSRISPKKGLIDLVHAWAEVRRDGWILEIVGNDAEGYWHVVENEIERLGCGDSILKTPGLDDERKWEAYARADVFVLPTRTENFGIVVAEALYAGVPVITTKGAPWEGLVSNGAGWWIDIGEEPLKEAMSKAMDTPFDVLAGMGARGHDFAVREFDWKGIARGLVDAYADVLSGR